MSYDDYRQVVEDAATKATATPIPRPDDDEHQLRWLIERAHREGHWKTGDDAIGFMAAAQAILRSDWLARVKRATKAEALEAAANTFRGDTYAGTEVAGRLRARAAVYREQAGESFGETATVALPPNTNKQHDEWCHWSAGCCGCTCDTVPFGTHDPSVDEERKHSI